MKKMPATVRASHPQATGPSWAAAAAPRAMEATEARLIFGSARRQSPAPKDPAGTDGAPANSWKDAPLLTAALGP